jgi:hypothetical protein
METYGMRISYERWLLYLFCSRNLLIPSEGLFFQETYEHESRSLGECTPIEYRIENISQKWKDCS